MLPTLSGIQAALATGAVGALAVGAVLVYKNHEIGGLKKEAVQYQAAIKDYQFAVGVWKLNTRTVELGLKQCNQGVQDTADAANRIGAAGVAALQEVQKAGQSVDRRVRAIDAMPKETCEDAFHILKESTHGN